MARPEKDVVPRFFNDNATSYDKIVSLCTFGKDKNWKKEILEKIPQCDSILELACGTGILTKQILQKFPQAKIIGVDVTESYLAIAQKKFVSDHNVSFIRQDAEKLNLNSKFDCIVSSYIPKYCNPQILISICLKHLKPGGKIIFHDFIYPTNNFVRIFWNLYFVLLNFIGNFIPTWKQVFIELPKLIRSTKWLKEYESVMIKHGLKVQRQEITWHSSAILTGKNIV